MRAAEPLPLNTPNACQYVCMRRIINHVRCHTSSESDLVRIERDCAAETSYHLIVLCCTCAANTSTPHSIYLASALLRTNMWTSFLSICLAFMLAAANATTDVGCKIANCGGKSPLLR